MAQADAEESPATLPKEPHNSVPRPTRPIRKKPSSIRYGLLASAAVLIAVLVALAATGNLPPKSPLSQPTLTVVNLVDVHSQSFGPNTTGAIVASFNSTGADFWINGAVNVTGCTASGDYCLANAWLFPTNLWYVYLDTGYLDGYCLNHSPIGNCQPEQNIDIATAPVSDFAGQSLSVCIWSNASTGSQVFSADVNVSYYASSE